MNLRATTNPARRGLERYGANEPVPTRRWPALREPLGLFTDPLLLILLIAAFASILLGQHTDAAIVLVIVFVSLTIEFIQMYRFQVAAERLQSRVAAARATLMQARSC